MDSNIHWISSAIDTMKLHNCHHVNEEALRISFDDLSQGYFLFLTINGPDIFIISLRAADINA